MSKWKFECLSSVIDVPMPTDKFFLGKYKYAIEKATTVITRTYSKPILVTGKILKQKKIVEVTITTPMAIRRSV